jgi:hypothetical protein
VKLFGFGQGLPNRAKFQEAHFVKQIETILWKNETVLLSEFVKEGNDVPEKEPCYTSVQKQEETKSLNGHPFTYMAITNWRVLLGYPMSGVVASKAFAQNEVSLFTDQNGQNVCIATKYDQSTTYLTYIVSNNAYKFLEANRLNPIPNPEERTHFLEYPEEWGTGAENDGQRWIAEMSRKNSGSNYAIVKQCEKCGNRITSPEIFPPEYFDFCDKCLRKSH